MYGLEQKKRLQQREQPTTVRHRGINRRMVALLPSERLAVAKLLLTAKATILQQLLNIEAQRLTCCIKIDAPRFKSRAGLLIMHGKVLACVYGNKTMKHYQLFGKSAYDKLMAEITHPDNIFDSYLLSEDIAMAAGSMFHDQIIFGTSGESQNDVLYSILDQFDKGDAPGSIAFVDPLNGPLCVSYFSKRQLIGSQPIFDAVPLPSLHAVTKYLKDNPNTQVLGSMLNRERYNHLKDLTFSLSGVNNKQTGYLHSRDSGVEATGQILVQSVKPQSCRVSAPATQFINTQRQQSSAYDASIPDTHQFKVHTAYPCYFKQSNA